MPIKELVIRQEIAEGPKPWAELTPWPWPRSCTARILIVTDGFTFTPSPGGFSLDELITKALNASGKWGINFSVTKAHRGTGAGADIANFKFDQPATAPLNRPFNLNNYDQVWLFGIASVYSTPGNPAGLQHTLSINELAALTEFMNKGGGVFATGDHEDLGLALCGEIPRVRTMRKWYFNSPPPPSPDRPKAPPIGGVDRLDTLLAGPTAGFQFEDQSDATPQTIYPASFPGGGSTLPHPLLRKNGGGAITSLPDHAHEGECIIPTDLTKTYTFGSVKGDEYPLMTGSTALRISPEIVAVAVSSGGPLDFMPSKPKVRPRCFGVIGGYDGHRAGVGRVAVDATWHHFIDINLNGLGSSRTGLYIGGSPTAEYNEIKQYYRNIALWLSPPPLQRCFNRLPFLALRYLYPLVEEIRPIPNPGWADILGLGATVRSMIATQGSPADVEITAQSLAAALPEKTRQLLQPLIDPWLPQSAQAGEPFPTYVSVTAVNAILGGAMIAVANKLPENLQQAINVVAQDDGLVEKLLSEGASLGVKNFAQATERSAQALQQLANSIL